MANIFLRLFFSLVILVSVSGVSYAAALPGPADAGRIEQREGLSSQQTTVSPPVEQTDIFPLSNAPPGSKEIKVTIHEVRITGMTVFETKDIKDIYSQYIDREVTLDTVWDIAAKVTERYRNAGYFLTHVIVPPQEVKDGTIVLRVAEGYIGEVKLDESVSKNRVIKKWVNKLQSYRPIKAGQIESILLHINDLPGVNLHAVLEPMENVESTEGAVRLVLEQRNQPKVAGSVSFDNNGSRFLGPYEAEAQAEVVLLPNQKTTASILSTFTNEIQYGSLKHEMPLFMAATLELYGSYTKARPGYTLKPEEIDSESSSLGAAVNYSLIRQRQENLSTRIAIEGQDTDSDILGTPLTRDAIRTLRVALNYQLADVWNGSNTLNGILSHGLNILGASQPGQENLSRAEATPNFTKFNVDTSRLQVLTEEWSVFLAASAQVASGPLYSSEQFGYGGQAFGRAYDNSEITGDNGIDWSAEVRYSGIENWNDFQPIPYTFYDMGAVWNLGADQTVPDASGSSIGAGIRLVSEFGISTNFGLGFPLTRTIANPIYGNGKNPRYFMQITYGF